MNKKEARHDFSDILKSANYIGGKWYDSGSSTQEIRDKYTRELIAEVPMASAEQVEAAITAADQAATQFKKWSASQKRDHLEKLLDLFRQHTDAFARLMVAEAGKPLSYAQGEVNRCQTTLQLAVDETTRFSGEVVNVDYDAGEGRIAYTRRFPVGPIACISPFNFPLNLALHKLAPALATGCPVVLKPSPYAPLSCLAFAGLIEEAGYPAGFVNIFLAGNDEAEAMITDERTKLFTFTGSPKVGWELKAKARKKKVILELGGNAATVVEETADLDHAAERLAIGSFLYAGQICISTQRVFIQESVYEEFKEKFIAEVKKLGVGDPMDEDVRVGPVIAPEHLERISEWVEEAKEAGAEVLLGGKIQDKEANLYAPTVLANVPKDLKIVEQEAFGPVAILDTFTDFGEAIRKVNDSDFGLQAGVFTNRVDHMQLAHEEIVVAGLIINDVPGFRVDGMPYGGVKESGLGREGILYAMEDYTEPRLIVLPKHQF